MQLFQGRSQRCTFDCSDEELHGDNRRRNLEDASNRSNVSPGPPVRLPIFFFFFPWDSSFLVGQIRRLGQTRWLPSVAGAISFPGGSTPANWLRLPWFQFSQVYALVRAHYRSAIHLSLSLSLSLLSVFWLLSSSHSLPTLFKPSTGQPSVTPRPHPKASPQELQQRKILHVRRKI